MVQGMHALLLLVALSAAPDCAADAPVTLSFKKGATPAQLAKWASANLCEKFSVDPAVAKHTSPIAVSGKVPRGAARQLFTALLRTMELGVQRDAVGAWLVKRGTAAAATGCEPEQRAALLGGMRTISPTEHALSRKDFAAWSDACLAREARIVPAITDGKPSGFKLFAIRPGSLGAALGFQNGDTVETMNGLTLDTADAALEAYTKARQADVLHFGVKRRGEYLEVVVHFEGHSRP